MLSFNENIVPKDNITQSLDNIVIVCDKTNYYSVKFIFDKSNNFFSNANTEGMLGLSVFAIKNTP